MVVLFFYTMENEKEKKKVGAKLKYNSDYHDAKAFSYFARGYTNALVAKKFKISPRTLDYWIEQFESLRESVLDGREVSNSRSELKLHKMGHGFYQEVTEPKVVGGELQMVTYPKYFPPSFSALRFEMINKMPHLYRDKIEETEKEEVTKPVAINIKVVKNDD